MEQLIKKRTTYIEIYYVQILNYVHMQHMRVKKHTKKWKEGKQTEKILATIKRNRGVNVAVKSLYELSGKTLRSR